MARPGILNIDAIAKEANVSIATVSRVVNNRSEVSDHLRRQVKRVMAKHGYRPRVISNRPTNLAIVLELENALIEEFAAGVLSGIAEYAFDQGVETSLLFLPAGRMTGTDLVKALRERRCDAAVPIFSSRLKEELPVLVEADIPLMLVAERSNVEGVGYFDSDSFGGACLLTRHLIELGHERIGFLCGPMENNHDHQQRLAAFKQTMVQANLKVDPAWIIEHRSTYQTQQAGYDQARRALTHNPSLTALFATNDAMACGAVLACVEAGRRIPEDISVVGFDDEPGSAYMNPPLTTAAQPMRRMGYEAARGADTLARGVIDEPPRQVLPCELVVRKSSGPAPES